MEMPCIQEVVFFFLLPNPHVQEGEMLPVMYRKGWGRGLWDFLKTQDRNLWTKDGKMEFTIPIPEEMGNCLASNLF